MLWTEVKSTPFCDKLGRNQFLEPEGRRQRLFGYGWKIFTSTLGALLLTRTDCKLRFNNVYDLIHDEDGRGTDMLSVANDEIAFVRENSFVNFWREEPKVEAFFHNKLPIRCFVSAEHHNTVILKDKSEIDKVFVSISQVIPILFSWFFKAKNAIKKDTNEYKLLKSLSNETADEWLSLLNKIAEENNYSIRNIIIDEQLKKYAQATADRERGDCERKISETQRNIKDLNDRVQEMIEQLQLLKIRELGLSMKDYEANSSSIKDFFVQNKNIDLLGINESRIHFRVRGKLENYDVDLAQRLLNNDEWVMIRHSRFPKQKAKQLLKALFIDNLISINFMAEYEVSPTGVSGLKATDTRADYDYEDINKCLPNPHIYYYGCLGNYQPMMNEALQRGDIVGAISLCIASCSSLNLGDMLVMGNFATRFWIEDCFILPDGRNVCAEEAVEWLEKEGYNES